MKPVTTYTDFRTYLSDWIKDRKSQGLPGSNRWFAMKMGINSTSWLTMVLKGSKGLSKVTANRISEILRHSPIELRYFETLVSFNQARSLDERNKYYGELVSLQKLKDVLTVKPSQYDFYSTWYHSVVRSLVGMFSIKAGVDAHEQLAAMVSPPITPAQARKSIELLEKLGFICINTQGFYELSDGAITSGENTKSLGIANFQKETMRLAQEALDRYTTSERYFGTVTIGVGYSAFDKIKELLIDTSNKIAEIANADAEGQRVYQINLQAYPLSKVIKRSSEDEHDERKPNESA
jgi:uncharacterized protein (TIGR02147 family)